jgi:hypothetical protein
MTAKSVFKFKLERATHADLALRDKSFWRSRTPEERLAEVERLVSEADSSSMSAPAHFEAFLRLLESNRLTT